MTVPNFGDGRFLPEVQLGEGNLEPVARPADAELLATVNAAFKRTGSAGHGTLYNGELGIVNGEV